MRPSRESKLQFAATRKKNAGSEKPQLKPSEGSSETSAKTATAT
jgi:hypothetical protein